MEEPKFLKRKRKAITENNETLLASSCTDLAELYVKEGRYSLAIKEYETVAGIYKKGNKLIEYAQANRAIGEAYMGMQNFEKALEHQRLYLSVAKEENDKLEQQRALATIGHIYLSWYLDTQTDPEKKLNSAYKFFMKSLMIAESLTGINKLEKVDMMARLFSNLGLVKECLGDYNKALELLNRSIGICKQHDIYEQLHRGYLSIASLYEKQGEYNEAIRHYNLAIDSAKKLKGNVDLMCAGLLVKSEALVKLADFHGAKQALLKAYKLKTPNIKDRRMIEHNLRIGNRRPAMTLSKQIHKHM